MQKTKMTNFRVSGIHFSILYKKGGFSYYL